MDEFDHISEEELLLAEKLAAHLDGDKTGDASLEELAPPLALLANFKRFEMSPGAQARGRAEVDEWAKASQAQRPKEKGTAAGPQWRWFYWLPVPTVAALALVVGLLSRPGKEEGESVARSKPSTPQSAPEERGFQAVPPRYHVGETPRALLTAQAAVLAQREPGPAKTLARDEFERQMRAYRGQLIASLEVGGR